MYVSHGLAGMTCCMPGDKMSPQSLEATTVDDIPQLPRLAIVSKIRIRRGRWATAELEAWTGDCTCMPIAYYRGLWVGRHRTRVIGILEAACLGLHGVI